jgi:alpha-tubulin suppressor-like RCC1 family protein
MATSGFTINGNDLGNNLVPKSYLMDRYPELANTFKTAGLWGWGSNVLGGPLGVNDTNPRSSPVQTIAGGSNWKQVIVGTWIVGATKTDGTLWVWGYNTTGGLGTNDKVSYSSPVQTIAGGTNWKQFDVSSYTKIAGIKTDGTLWIWGSNNYGQLGDNTTVGKSSPVQTVSAVTTWKYVSVNTNTCGAIKTDGTLWMWGRNNYGQLGNNNATINQSSPVQTVSGGTTWKYVSLGRNINAHVAAIKTDGTLWMWGYNSYGQLGNNSITNYSSPIQTIAGGTNWKQVSAGYQNTGAIKTDGTLWTWGMNTYANLGDGTSGTVPTAITANSKSSPVQTIAGGTNWYNVSMAAASSGACAAVKTDGTLWTWGYNINGQLGDNTLINRSSPIQTVSGGTNWKQVSAGNFTMAIRDDSADFGIGTL